MNLSIMTRCMPVIILVVLYIVPMTKGFKTLCYWTNWSRDRPGDMRLRPQDLDPYLCTHLIYAFGLVRDLDIVRTRWDDTDVRHGETEPGFTLFNNLKKKNGELVTILSLGGAKAGPTAFDEPAATAGNRATFAANTVRFLRRWNFDGVDIDWEYPVNGTLFTHLLEALSSAFDAEIIHANKKRLLLTVAASVSDEYINKIYDIPGINRTVDYLNVMAYDFHGSWGGLTAFNSPLYSRTSTIQFDQNLSQDWAVHQYIQNGMHPSKIILGLSSYGRAYQLTDRTQHGVNAPMNTSSSKGRLLQDVEYRMYPEVCDFKREHNARYHFDDEQKCPFVYTIDFWIGYDDTKSFKIKTQYAMDNKLGGVVIWTLDYDDIGGKHCKQGPFPLMNAIKSTIAGDTSRIPLLPPLGYLPSKQAPSSVVETTELYKKVCYFTNWSVRREENAGQFTLDNVNTEICTHLVYAFVFVDEVGYSLLPVYNDDESLSSTQQGLFEIFNILKQRKRTLKTLLSVGGLTAETRPFDVISKDDASRRRFALNVIYYLGNWGFDGLDIAWEFPGTPPETKRQFTLLVQVLSEEFDKHQQQTGGSRLILSAAVAAEAEQIDKGYEIAKISKYLDFINVLTYTYQRTDRRTSFVSPLYAKAGDNATIRLNQEWSIDRWIKGGVPAKKLLLGLTGMGRSFQLEWAQYHNPGAQITYNDVKGPILGEKGIMLHYEICDYINRGATERYDKDQVGAYIYHNTVWVGYESRRSIQAKIAWLKDRGLGGYFFWSLDYDDFKGTHCNCGRFPLLTAAHQAITGENVLCPGESEPDSTSTPPDVKKSRTRAPYRPPIISVKTENSAKSLRKFPHLLAAILIAHIFVLVHL